MTNALAYSPERLRVSRIYNAPVAAKEHGAELVVSLLSPYLRMPSLVGSQHVSQHRIHYFEDKHDIETPGMQNAVRDLVQLGQLWRDSREIPRTLVHCHYGVSRSTASTYILLNAAYPDILPAKHLESLLQITNKPAPNMRMVKFAAELLGAREEIIQPIEQYRKRHPHRLAAHVRMQDALARGINLYATDIITPIPSEYWDRRGHLVVPLPSTTIEARTAIYVSLRCAEKILLAWPKFANGFADLAGGGIDASENLEQAMFREWIEETGFSFPFSYGVPPQNQYEQRINFYAEDTNRLLGSYHQIFRSYDLTPHQAPDLTAQALWKTEEGMASWEDIRDLPKLPINRAHWRAIQALVPEMKNVRQMPESRNPRLFLNYAYPS